MPFSPTYCSLHTWQPKLSLTNSYNVPTLLNFTSSRNSASSDVFDGRRMVCAAVTHSALLNSPSWLT